MATMPKKKPLGISISMLSMPKKRAADDADLSDDEMDDEHPGSEDDRDGMPGPGGSADEEPATDQDDMDPMDYDGPQDDEGAEPSMHGLDHLSDDELLAELKKRGLMHQLEHGEPDEDDQPESPHGDGSDSDY